MPPASATLPKLTPTAALQSRIPVTRAMVAADKPKIVRLKLRKGGSMKQASWQVGAHLLVATKRDDAPGRTFWALNARRADTLEEALRRINSGEG
jgi:hypothetical protein